MKEGFLGISGM